jgi:maltooligosyltrehalose synthase
VLKMTVRIELSEIFYEFHKAQGHLVDLLGGSDFILREADFLKVHYLVILQDAWLEHYRIKVLDNDLSWDVLEFVDEKQYTYFLLKWS